MLWQKRTFMATALAMAIAIVGAATAFAADAPEDIPDGMDWNAAQGKLVDPFEVDAARYAKAFDRDYSEQIKQLRSIVALDKPLAALENDKDYGGSYWASVDELVVMFKGGAPKATLTSLRSKSPIKVTGKDVPYSLLDLDRIRDDAVAGVRAAGIADDDIVSGIDPKANAVFVTARATSASTRELARTKVANRTPDGAVSLSFTAGSVGEDTQADPPIVDNARWAVPRDDLVDVAEQPWSYLVIAPDGRTLEVYWQEGLPECRGLDRVEAARADGVLDVRVFTGEVADNKGCNAVLALWATTVAFEEPLALGGRGEIDAAWQAWQDEVWAIRLAAVHKLEEALPGTIRFFTNEAGREDFRLTAEGRADALEASGAHPETTRDDLVDYLLEREGLTPTYPPDPGQEPATSE